MIPAKEKAKELVYKFYPNVQWKLGQEDCLKRANNCALIAVDEILQIDCHDMSEEHFDNHIEYWVAVEKEIENYEL